MTTLTKPVKRETAVVYRGRPLIVELHPWGVSLREKGTRRTVSVDYRTALEVGYKLIARQAAADKKARKGGRKGNRRG